jgi:hypothetical protein
MLHNDMKGGMDNRGIQKGASGTPQKGQHGHQGQLGQQGQHGLLEHGKQEQHEQLVRQHHSNSFTNDILFVFR